MKKINHTQNRKPTLIFISKQQRTFLPFPFPSLFHPVDEQLQQQQKHTSKDKVKNVSSEEHQNHNNLWCAVSVNEIEAVVR